MVSLVKNPDLFGGQGVSEPPRLCYDCAHRPIEYARRPRPEGTPPCLKLVEHGITDPLAARDVCKGDFWAPPSNLGARDV